MFTVTQRRLISAAVLTTALLLAARASCTTYNVTVLDDSFKPVVKYSGPLLSHRARPKSRPEGTSVLEADCLVRGWRERKTARTEHQLYMIVLYSSKGYATFERAYFEQGIQATGFRRICYDMDSSSMIKGYLTQEEFQITEEHFAIDLSRQFLQDHDKSGFLVEAEGLDGTKAIFSVPGQYVQQYLKAVGSEPPGAPLESAAQLVGDGEKLERSELRGRCGGGW